MNQDIHCSPETTVREAARLMARHDREALAVVDAEGNELGRVSERDITRRAVAAGKDLQRPVREVMSSVPAGGEPNPLVNDDEGACCGMLPGRRGP